MSNTQIINDLIMSVTGGVTGSSTLASAFNYLDLPAHGDHTQSRWYEIKGTEWSFDIDLYGKSIVILNGTQKAKWYITNDGPVLASFMEFPGVCQRTFELNNMSPDTTSFVWRSGNVRWSCSDMPVTGYHIADFGKIELVIPTGWFCKDLPSPEEMQAQSEFSDLIIPSILGRSLEPLEHFQCNVSQRNGVYSFSVTLTYNDIPQTATKYFTLKNAADPIAVKYFVRTIVGVEI